MRSKLSQNQKKLQSRLRKGAKITLTDTMPDGEIKTTLCRVLSAKTRNYKTGPWTLVHLEEIE